MAKSKTAYLVTDQSPLFYQGKVASCGDVIEDLPGESIAWLMADGFIIPSSAQTAAAPTEEESK